MTASLLHRLWDNRPAVVWSLPDGTLQTTGPSCPPGILSGAFNPLHEGHAALRHASAEWLGEAVCFELPVCNADKPPLDLPEIERRRNQFAGYLLALTNAATFADKASLFPGTVFVVGVDTAERILQPQYYGGSTARMLRALQAIRRVHCRFLVAGRKLDGAFYTLDDLTVPEAVADLFETLPPDRFRHDLSSTEIRGNPGP